MECIEQGLTSTGSLRLEEEFEDNKMPFLQMLQSVEISSSSSFLPLKEPTASFQTLLRLQHLKKQQHQQQLYWEEGLFSGEYYNNNINNIIMPCEMETQIQAALDYNESCVTHDIVVELHGDPSVKSEAKDRYLQYPVLISTSECNQEERPAGSKDEGSKQTQNSKSISHHVVTRERRKRKRTRPTKNKEEVENQRMTHIAVERNRRRQMNDHLNVLRSLMPTSYIQRVIFP